MNRFVITLTLFLSNISGQEVFFEKEDWADVTDPDNWDHITESVAITRADFEGLYNPYVEDGYNNGSYYMGYGDASPVGTAWALMSTAEAMEAIELDTGTVYKSWVNAVVYPPTVVSGEQILSLWILEEDVYYDIDMVSWTSGEPDGGGGFAYWRYPAGGQDEEETTYVPDDNFEQALIDLGYDDVLDNYVVTDSISGVTELVVAEKEISDLTGIEDFIALTHLNCRTNALVGLDVSNNTLLTYLHAGSNQLTDLDVSQNTELTTLWVGFNSLDSLDVNANTALIDLRVPGNQLTSIDVSTNIALEHLDLWVNQLTTLDVNINTALTTLKASNNDIVALDVSANTALRNFYCENNQLTYLNMRNGITDSLTTFNATNNRDLTCIETLDPDYATENWTNANGNIDDGVTFSVICGAVGQDVWHVATTGSDGGAGTQESPFATIQMGINAAGDGNTVHVAAGSYNENISWIGKNLMVKGAGSEETIIDAQQLDNGVRIQNIANTSLFEGFTIKNGTTITQDYPWVFGGGICMINSHATLRDIIVEDCVLQDQDWQNGNGIFVGGSNSLFENVTVRNNEGGGIALSASGSYPVLKNVTIEGNTNGFGMRVYDTGVIMDSSEVVNNPAGGIWYEGVGFNPSVYTNSLFHNNGSEGSQFGAIHIMNSGATATFDHCTFYGNHSGGPGSDIYSQGNYFNEQYYGNDINIVNSIFYNEQESSIYLQPTEHLDTLSISYSSVLTMESIILDEVNHVNMGDGMLFGDPIFCDAENGEYTLAANSPCVGTGSEGGNMGALGVGCDDMWFPPVVSIPDTSMNEDSEFFYDLSAYISDVDSENLVVNVDHVSQPMSEHVQVQMIGPDTLRLFARHDWHGSGTIRIRVQDEQSTTREPFTLTVHPVNDAPVFGNLSALVGVGMEFQIPIHVSDVDMDSLVVSFDDSWTYPDWLSLAAEPYRLVGTAPGQGQSHFPIGVSDGDTSVTDTFHLSAQFFNPRITSIIDVPDDQGGRVYIDFRRSFFDRPNQPNGLYTIFRRDMIDNVHEWVVVGSGAAIGENSYIYEVPTLRDSTADDNGMTQFKVVASMDEGDFHSPPHSGYSIDNIAPGVPTGLQLLANNTSITVTWDPSGDDDFQYFLLERSTNTDFTANEIVTIEMVDTVYTDEAIDLGQEYFYRLAALDHAGNKSEYTQAMSVTLAIDPSSLIPDVFAMHQNYPNPFNPVTQIRYDLPEDSYVSITIYDIMGRNIKSLVNTDQTAGYRSIRWNATNDLGEPVSAGMYIYMIQAGEFRQTRKMVLLK